MSITFGKFAEQAEQEDPKAKRLKMIKRQVLQKKVQAVRQGAGEDIVLSGGFVLPLSQTLSNDSNTISKVTFDVNERLNNYDNISGQYAAVDDILISFSSPWDNDNNLAYVLSDTISMMTTITIFDICGLVKQGNGFRHFPKQTFERRCITSSK